MLRDDLARYATGLCFKDLPTSAIEATKRLLLDHVCMMLAGPMAFGDDMPDLFGFVRDQGGRAESTVVGLPGRYPCLAATLANTTMSFTAIDAWHKPSATHAQTVLFSAAIAVAERQGASGRDLIAALVAGTEILTRLGMALDPHKVYARGFHPTSVVGGVGCAVAAGKLIGLDARRMAEAISIAAVHGAGSSIWTGARFPTSFCLQIGRSAESGVLAAFMAERGCLGVEPVFEDPRGFLAAYSGHVDASKLTDGLGKRYETERFMMERYWFGVYLLTSIETLLTLMQEHALEADDIASINGRIPTTCVPLIGDPQYPETRHAAMTATPYALAAVAHLKEKALYSPAVLSWESLRSPKVRALSERITIEGDDELNRLFPEKVPCILTLVTRDGRRFTVRNEGPIKGEPAMPLTDADLEAKFAKMARPALKGDRGDQLFESVRRIDTMENVGQMAQLLGAG